MRVFLKYVSVFLVVMLLALFGIINADQTKVYLSDYLSQKSKNDVVVTELRLSSYPIIGVKLRLNGLTDVHLVGEMGLEGMDANCTLRGEGLRYGKFYLRERIDFQAHLTGSYRLLEITGEGNLSNQHHQLLGELHLTKGHWDVPHQALEVEYRLDIEALERLEPYLHHRYKGAFQTQGVATYRDRNLTLEGKTHTFDGELRYLYANGQWRLDFYGVSLVKLLRQYDYDALVEAKVFGVVTHDPRLKKAHIDTQLKEARFRHSRLTKMLRERTGINLLSHRYDQSSFKGDYQEGELLADIKIDDGKEHLYLLKTHVVGKTKQLHSDFELRMQHQEIYGTIEGTLEHPKVTLDVSRVLQHQIESHLGDFLTPQQQRELKSQLNGVDLEEVKERAKSFLEGLF